MTTPAVPEPTPLSALVGWLDAAGLDPHLSGAPGQVSVRGVSLSSQRIVPGDLYAALPGSRVHGIRFADPAVEAGAVAILTDHDGAAAYAGSATVPVVTVADPRSALGQVAAGVFDYPAAAMRMIGVTGTQGKTTTTRLAEGALQEAGVRAAVVGTVGTRIDGEDVASTLTTPEAPDLQRLFARMRERSVEACAMEVSSHALVMGRVDGVVFDVAVFLNLGRDHLDFHHDVEDYYRAKARLFTPDHARLALVNVDDDHGRRLAGETVLPVRTLSVHDPAADWRASDVVSDPAGSTFTVHGPEGRRVQARVGIPGGFNVANGLAAVAAGVEAGFDLAAVAAGLGVGGVPGRLERVLAGQPFDVLVDYAHKPDAVEAALRTLRPLTRGRLVVVLGAGGDRDPGKRPIMGAIAARLADVVVVTDDNPRTEDPAVIRGALLDGAREQGARGPVGEVVEVGDRRAAIAEALRRAEAGDIVLIAGKGHEAGQEIEGTVHPFDDRSVVRRLLEVSS